MRASCSEFCARATRLGPEAWPEWILGMTDVRRRSPSTCRPVPPVSAGCPRCLVGGVIRAVVEEIAVGLFLTDVVAAIPPESDLVVHQDDSLKLAPGVVGHLNSSDAMTRNVVPDGFLNHGHRLPLRGVVIQAVGVEGLARLGVHAPEGSR